MGKITIIKLIAFIVLIFLLVQIISCHANAEDKYPLFLGKSAEEKRLEDPVYRHKQLMEQLMRIECVIYENRRHEGRVVSFNSKKRKYHEKRYEKACKIGKY